MEGTITWFEISKNTPPVADYYHTLHKRSANLLVWGKGGWTQQTYYIHATKTWFAADELPFTVTHWAFINYPTD